MKIIELETRHDSQGSGDFGSPRGNRIHQGRDYIVIPGKSFPSLITGKMVRAARPYKDTDEYTGCLVKNGRFEIKMFYMQPIKKVGENVRAGEALGIGQDVSLRYPPKGPRGPMTPHVHVEFRFNGVLYDPIILVEYYKNVFLEL